MMRPKAAAAAGKPVWPEERGYHFSGYLYSCRPTNFSLTAKWGLQFEFSEICVCCSYILVMGCFMFRREGLLELLAPGGLMLGSAPNFQLQYVWLSLLLVSLCQIGWCYRRVINVIATSTIFFHGPRHTITFYPDRPYPPKIADLLKYLSARIHNHAS